MIEFTAQVDILIHTIKKIKREIELIDNPELYNEDFYKKTPSIVDDLNNKLKIWKENSFSSQLLSSVKDIINKYNNNLEKPMNIYHTDIVDNYNNKFNILL